MNLLKFVRVADALASLSKDPSTQVGCVAVDDDGNLLSAGFNGFPRGVSDDPARYADRPTKLAMIAHAEANCVAQAARTGARLKGASLIVTALHPCADCAKLIIQAGIVRVYAPTMPPESKWTESAEIAALLFREAGVEVVEYVA